VSRQTAARALALFAVSLLVYLANGEVLPGNDAKANAYTPASLLGAGELAFSPSRFPFMFRWQLSDEKGTVFVRFSDWLARPADSGQTYAELFGSGRLRFAGYAAYLVPTLRARPGSGEPLFVNTFGPGAGLAALPAALAGSAFLDMDVRNDHRDVWRLAKFTAALLVAASVAIVYLIAAPFTTRARAALLAGAYAVGTCAWSISSQTLWQQTAALFFLSLGTLCIVRGNTAWIRGAAAGLAFSAAMACRPTGVVVLAAAAAYLAVADRRSLYAFVIAALPLGVALGAYNFHYFGSPLAFGQMAMGEHLAQLKTGSPDPWQTPVWLGASGLLLSPSRGLLVHSPFLAAAFAGAVIAWRQPRFAALRFVPVAVLLLWIPAFLWFDWWGGWTYGYRPIVDTTPLLAVLCVPALDRVLERRAWRIVFFAALAWSVLVQIVGVFAYTPLAWNARVLDSGEHADVDAPQYRHRLWSFHDWQIAYFMRRFPQSFTESRAYAAAWVAEPHN